MIAYPVDITPDGDALLVRFPDVPEAITFGDSQADALTRARDALETALIAYVEARQPLPEPSAKPGSHVISVSALSEAKLTLHRLLLERHMTDAELGRRIGVSAAAVRKLLDLRVETPLSEIEEAFRALHRKLTIQVVDAA